MTTLTFSDGRHAIPTEDGLAPCPFISNLPETSVNNASNRSESDLRSCEVT